MAKKILIRAKAPKSKRIHRYKGYFHISIPDTNPFPHGVRYECLILKITHDAHDNTLEETYLMSVYFKSGLTELAGLKYNVKFAATVFLPAAVTPPELIHALLHYPQEPGEAVMRLDIWVEIPGALRMDRVEVPLPVDSQLHDDGDESEDNEWGDDESVHAEWVDDRLDSVAPKTKSRRRAPGGPTPVGRIIC